MFRCLPLALSLVSLLCITSFAEAKRQQAQPKQMMKIGDEVVSLEAGQAFVKAQQLLSDKQFEQASEVLKGALETNPNSAALRYKYGFSFLQQGKNTEALEQAKRCTELAPKFFGGWALLGETSVNLHLDDQAKAAYQQALGIQSTGENADIIREHLSDLSGQNQPAPVETAEDKQVADQNRGIMKLNRALSLCDKANDFAKQKQFEQGLQTSRNALKIAPESAEVKENAVIFLNNYAADCVQKQNLKQAETLMKEALALQTNGGVTSQSKMTTLKNYLALLKFLGRAGEATQIEAQMKAVPGK